MAEPTNNGGVPILSVNAHHPRGKGTEGTREQPSSHKDLAVPSCSLVPSFPRSLVPSTSYAANGAIVPLRLATGLHDLREPEDEGVLAGPTDPLLEGGAALALPAVG
jgi:hypothetical protein